MSESGFIPFIYLASGLFFFLLGLTIETADMPSYWLNEATEVARTDDEAVARIEAGLRKLPVPRGARWRGTQYTGSA